MSQWISVAEARSIAPGEGRTVFASGRNYAVYNLEGEFYAIDDECPHRGGSLGAGFLQDGQVYCPLHAWKFDVKTGACGSNSERPVRTHPTRVVNGEVQIEIDGRT